MRPWLEATGIFIGGLAFVIGLAYVLCRHPLPAALGFFVLLSFAIITVIRQYR